MSSSFSFARRFLQTSAVVCSLVALGGCTAAERVSSVNDTFLEGSDMSAKRPNLPFDHSWVSAEVKRGNYQLVFIKPVRTDKLPPDAWKRSASYAITSKDDYDEAAARLATYFRGQLREQIKEQPNHEFTLADNSTGPRTLVIEIALTELEFSHPVARAGALAAPIPGTGPALSTITDPHVAFAARITDGPTGRLVATVADRKFPPMRIVDFNKLTVESSPREVCQLWSESIAKALDGNGKDPITEEKFSLLPS